MKSRCCNAEVKTRVVGLRTSLKLCTKCGQECGLNHKFRLTSGVRKARMIFKRQPKKV